jgi:hydrogenase nickel incorporation protein HypB
VPNLRMLGHAGKRHQQGRGRCVARFAIGQQRGRRAQPRALRCAWVLAINLMSSPGAGKDRVAGGDDRRAARSLSDRRHRGRSGDRQRRGAHPRTRRAGHTDHDRNRLPPRCAPRASGAARFAARGLDLLFIENVGNLVCPASFDLGQHRNVTLLSVTEGDDKPAKYPVIFRASDLVVLEQGGSARGVGRFRSRAGGGGLRALGRDTPMIQTAARRAPALGPGSAGWSSSSAHGGR